MDKSRLYNQVVSDYNYHRWSGRENTTEALERLKKIDINANVFFQNPGKMVDTMLVDNKYNPMQRNAIIFNAGDLVVMQLADKMSDNDDRAQENRKKTVELLFKLKPKLSTYALKYVKYQMDVQKREIETKQREIA